jgi:hypothetical protein
MRKLFLLLFFVIAAVGKIVAAEPVRPEIKFAALSTTNGFSVGIVAIDERPRRITFDTQLAFTIWASGNPLYIGLPAKREYLYDLHLLDRFGHEVPRTSLGKQVGKSFEKLDPKFTYLRGTSPDKKTGVSLDRIRIQDLSETPAFLLLPRLTDLFTPKEPGEYVLSMRFQIVNLSHTNFSGPDRQLVRFPFMELRLAFLGD